MQILTIVVKMVGKDSVKRSYSLDQVLTERDIEHILRQAIKHTNYELICSEVKPASEGLSGYLGDHMKAVLHVGVKDGIQKVNLFVKRIPVENKPKAEFIDENNFFKREMLMFQILDEMEADKGPNPWCAKAYVCTNSLLVMPDLSAAGYREHALLEPLDLAHVLLTAAAVARYHAAFANYEIKKILNVVRPYNFYQEHQHILQEPTFKDTPWVRTGAKLTADFLDAFSTKYTKRAIPDLELKLAKSFVAACDSFVVAEDTLNVLVHRDLWNNNILFKYEEGKPANAILIDFQCLRYGPPAFDLMSFLYLTTSRRFRKDYESRVFKYYFQVFSESLEEVTKKTLDMLGYHEKDFLSWCEKSRMFGIFAAVAINPQVLMDPKSGEEIFANPDTFLVMMEADRSGPVVEYAKNYPLYKERQLEVSEEYVGRYILGLSYS